MRSTGVSARNLKRSWKKLIWNPHSRGNELHRDLAGFYKIKLLKDGYRLVYQVIDERIVIYVIAVGRRADNEIYALATKRTD
jgi:mRNA interferase RelE/StbE